MKLQLIVYGKGQKQPRFYFNKSLCKIKFFPESIVKPVRLQVSSKICKQDKCSLICLNETQREWGLTHSISCYAYAKENSQRERDNEIRTPK